MSFGSPIYSRLDVGTTDVNLVTYIHIYLVDWSCVNIINYYLTLSSTAILIVIITVVGMSWRPQALDKTLFIDTYHSILIPSNIIPSISHLLNNVLLLGRCLMCSWNILRFILIYRYSVDFLTKTNTNKYYVEEF